MSGDGWQDQPYNARTLIGAFNWPARHWPEKTPRTLRRWLRLEPAISRPRHAASRRALIPADYLAPPKVRALAAGFFLGGKVCRAGVLLLPEGLTLRLSPAITLATQILKRGFSDDTTMLTNIREPGQDLLLDGKLNRIF